MQYILEIDQAVTTAKIFKSGNSQAVRLPKEFRVKAKEVEIFRRGDEIVLREKQSGRGMTEFLGALRAIPLDAFEDIKDTQPPEDCKDL